MLLYLFLSVLALFGRHDSRHIEQPRQFVPTPYGPQTLEEEDRVRTALYGEHVGGDMIFPDGWNALAADSYAKLDRFRWQGGIIPFVIDPSLAHIQGLIQQGMAEYHKNTCIRFVPRRNETDYVRMYRGTGCWSIIGRKGGEQLLSLDKDCWYKGLVMHELGHAIGRVHEHQRPDRDNYIIVNKNNTHPSQWSNFYLIDGQNIITHTAYDQDNMMHYGNFAFSTQPNVLYTLIAKNGKPLLDPWQKHSFTNSDIVDMKRLYNCS